MSETTTTPNYGLIKPNVNADSDLWGDHLNSDMDIIDSKMKSIENKAGVVSFNTRSGAVSLLQADVTTVLPPGAGTPAMDGTASAGTLLTWSKSDHVHPTDTSRYAASNPAGYVTAGGAATAAPVQSVATRTGAVVLTHNDLTDWAATLAPYAPLASPTFTGTPSLPTGTTGITQAPGTSNTSIATTAFVAANAGVPSSTPPIMDGTAAPGVATALSRGDHVHPSDTSRAPLASPALTGSPTAPTPLPASDNSTNIATTAFVQAAVGTANHNIGRNLLHNPLFNVAQRGFGAFTANGVYTADRWQSTFFFDAMSVQVGTDISDASRTAIGDESVRGYLSVGVTGNAGATAYSFVTQKIEHVSRLAGKTVTVSFWGAATAALKLGVNISQVFGSGGSPSAAINTNGVAVQLTTTWGTRYSVTIVVPSIIGKTLGTNGDDWTQVNFWFSCGTTNAAIAGNIGVQSGTFVFTGVQLEVGSVATPLEKPDPRYDQSNCERFFWSSGMIMLGMNAGSGGTFYATSTFPTTMRASPTLVISSDTSSGLNARTIAAYGSNYAYVSASPVTANTVVLFNVKFTASADL